MADTKKEKARVKVSTVTRKTNPSLQLRQRNNGLSTFFLEYYLGYVRERSLDEHGDPAFDKNGQPKYKIKHSRKKESLDLYIYDNPKTPAERAHNKEAKALANKIRDEREQEFLKNKTGYRLQQENKNLFIFWERFIDETKVKDKRLLKDALKNFRMFLVEEYGELFSISIQGKQITPDMMQKFVYYLEDHHRGEGRETYYNRFKRLINVAVDKNLITKSPCKGIHIAKASDLLLKDVLSAEELERLFATHYKGESKEIRRAFAVTCFLGLRKCDVVRLEYKNVDYANKRLSYRQSKVEHSSGKSGVTVPLSDSMLAVIGKKKADATDDYIFHLPSDTMCLKALRHWTKKAGIDKHITWHCGRHSLATILLTGGTNIKVVSDLLGHSSLRMTEKYVRAVDAEKERALNSLPKLDVNNI